MRPMFAPSLMCADLLHVGESIRTTEALADMFHLDIMDGHFAPNITLSPDFVRAVRSATSKPLDAHLMVDNPLAFVDKIIDAGADYVTLHAEVISNIAFRTIDYIHSRGCKVGVAFCPATPLSIGQHYLSRVDLITLMSVDIGYGGQPFIPEMLEKAAEAVKFRTEHGLNYLIQADGCCNTTTYRQMHEAGIDVYVLGTGLYRKEMSLEKSAARVREEFASCLSGASH